MIETLQLTRMGYSPKTYKRFIVQDDPFGWCVLKRRPRPYAPDEVILQDMPIGTALGASIPFQPWWSKMRMINGAEEMAWWLTYEAEKFNNDANPDEREINPDLPINIRCTGDGGNLKAFYKDMQTNTHIRLVAYDYLHPEFIDPFIDNFDIKPWMVSLCTAIDAGGLVHKIAGGIEPYYYQLYRTELWIRKTEVIMLDQKPYEWTKADVMKQWF
jgi:hypothetical protein